MEGNEENKVENKVEKIGTQIDFTKMCDLCYEQMKDEEDLFGFHVTDINGVARLFKGHKDCVDTMAEMFRDVYGNLKEEENTNEK